MDINANSDCKILIITVAYGSVKFTYYYTAVYRLYIFYTDIVLLIDFLVGYDRLPVDSLKM